MFIVSLVLSLSSVSASQFEPPEPVDEVVPGPASTFFPLEMCPTSHHMLFLAVHEYNFIPGLYRTRGEPGSTALLVEQEGADPETSLHFPYRLTGCSEARSHAFLYGSSPYGGQFLYGTDGTADGTRVLMTGSADVAVFPDTQLAIVGGTRWDGAIGTWMSDGTREGTTLLSPTVGFRFTNVGGVIDYFSSADGSAYQLWTTDGTPSGTRPYGPAASTDDYFEAPIATPQGWIYVFRDAQGFLTRVTLYRRDGVVVELGSLPQIPGWPIEQILQVGSKTYITPRGTPDRLMVTDGTQGSLQDLFALELAHEFDSIHLQRAGRFLFLPSYSPQTGYEPRVVDSETDDTWELADICPGPCDTLFRLFEQGESIFLSTVSDGAFLVSSDGHGLVPLTQGCGSACPEWLSDAVAWGSGVLLAGGFDADERLWFFDERSSSLTQLTSFSTEAARYEPDPYGHTPIFRDSAIFFGDGVDGRGLELWRVRASPEPCQPDPAHFCTGEARFRVRVQWRSFEGNWGEGVAAPLGSASGTFWFFDPANVEIAVKVVDGTAINGHFWVYYGALSNVEYWITIEDSVTGTVREYHNPLGAFGSFGDIEALPSSSGVSGGPLQVAQQAPTPATIEPFGSPTCFPSSTRVCLLDGRFAVEGTWEDFEGQIGVAYAEELTADTGYLWFFDADVAEILIKLVDGGDFNDHFWVYYGSLSNVEFTLFVTDTVSGEARPYFNPLGTFGSFGDIEAFPAD